MPVRHNSPLPWAGRLAIYVLALGACAVPAASVPTQPATATTLPPTAVPATIGAAQSTPAGSGNIAVPATSVQFYLPDHIAFDANNNLYVSSGDTLVSKVDQFGLLTKYAGSGGLPFSSGGFSGDGGPALSADFTNVGGLAFDRDGSLYVADAGNERIRRIDRNGMVSTVAGSGPGE